MYFLPAPAKKKFLQQISQFTNPIAKVARQSIMLNFFKGKLMQSKRKRYVVAAFLDFVCIVLILMNAAQPTARLVSPVIENLKPLQPLTSDKSTHEVFGFAPHWTFHKLESIDFDVLTTLAYFDVEVFGDGSLDTYSPGYQTFISEEATQLFKKAHKHGTRVVLTITQMQNNEIRNLMDDPAAQDRAINEVVTLVERRGIDGINLDFEYVGNPGSEYRAKFTDFARRLAENMHSRVPNSRVTASVYASAVKEPKIYEIGPLSQYLDGIFMMAYDFAVAGSDNAIPTSPLYGHKEGPKYWYDISTAVDDFLAVMPANKLILGVPYYGYNYLVYEPTVKAQTRPSWSWRGRPRADTLDAARSNITMDNPEIGEIREGWDDYGKVGYLAYYVPSTDTWRMVFLEDERSLGEKYQFAKDKALLGVGMWALGFDSNPTLWALLKDTFGDKLADITVLGKEISY